MAGRLPEDLQANPGPGEPGGAVRVAERARGRAAFTALRVARVERICEDAAAITFDVPRDLAERFAFLPGQSLTVRAVVDGRDERRSYSICSPAGGPLRIGVREIPGGLFSTWLVRHLRPGDTLAVQPPGGAFTADLSRPGHHVFIAAGSGITPVLSIASSALAVPGARATIFYGNRTTRTVMFAEELADLKDSAPARVELVHVLSREPREPELFTGRLDAAKLRVLLPALTAVREVAHWWLCGPYQMVVDARRVLAELGVPSERLHHELFYVDEPPPAPVRPVAGPGERATAEVTVILDGRATTAALPRDVTVLEGAQRVRPDLPFACKGGVCGTCRARVVDGEADMRRNFALEPREVEAGYVLTCQSFPSSARLTVDYDA
ncbi:phenylacetic acid degradation protein [Sphaerisporangium krabiense]|uniref:Ring-1,2-phenylacetyl-CoA epoxidase subunit PaaE n=1 Tax=Sphaerisporangium krabiense TaxID=763782 RepID=A0A7W8Z6E2_9ACTN|nr:1,2-phenylacetyl-CoA epoxidase subunit PaaE [Sphaerisporangium krabiense]MBB5628323.1 ring-1,2-phenylacetyl-CoA epoxidase subunit PaaE [Sphaerisporangium krabiense]GII66320.1 phenylacetic acid degradation protein [Sphaerisporangium krabiense]